MSYRFNYEAGTHMPDSETQKKSSRRCRPLVSFVTILLIMAIALQLSGCQAIRRDKPIETVDTPEIKTEDTPEDAVLSGSTEYPESASSEETTVKKTNEAAPPPAPPESEPVLTETSAGISAAPPFTCNYYMYVTGVDYYLALRTAKRYDAANEIGKIRNGERVQVMNDTTGQYWYVYASTVGKYGYVNSDYLTAGSPPAPYSSCYMYVTGVDYYLALRTAKSYDAANEIGRIFNGEAVEVLDSTTGTYWYVYAPTLGKKGYVNSKYLTAGSPPAPSSSCCMYVTGVDYYLALRTAKSYDAANEIGRIFNGEAVEVLDSTTGTYWYVYAPTLGKKGYVNSNYLTSYYSNEILQNDTYTVHGVDYYLALRTAPEYDGNNEIGKIYNGQTVEVISKYDTYWYVYAPSLNNYGYVNSNYLQ